MDLETLITTVRNGTGTPLEVNLVTAITRHRAEGDSTARDRLTDLETAANEYLDTHNNPDSNDLDRQIATTAVEVLLEDDRIDFGQAYMWAADEIGDRLASL